MQNPHPDQLLVVFSCVEHESGVDVSHSLFAQPVAPRQEVSGRVGIP